MEDLLMEYLLLIISAVFVNNVVFSQILGICPFLGVSRKLETALGMSGAVIFVITAASAVTWCVQRWVLLPLTLGYMQTIAFILVIAAFVQLLDILMKRFAPPLHKALGIYLPLITTNCAVLGVALINARLGSGFWYSVLHGFGTSSGFALALIIFSGIRERLDIAFPPKAFRGVALALVTAGLLALSFMGFQGLV